MTTRPVAMTAQFTAKAREVESQRPDALFHDPWAHLFSGRPGNAWLARQPQENPGLPLVIRTRYFDDFFQAHRNDPASEQVVILAAGYDTRAYRLEWPTQTRLYEIDQPAVLARKEELMQGANATPRCERHAIGMDLEFGWTAPLLAAGFQPEHPSLWLIEGLLMYLTPTDAETVMTTVARMASPGSRAALDLLNQATLTSPRTRDRVERLAQRGMPWQFGVDDPTAWLASLGWAAHTISVAEAGVHYQRWPHLLSAQSPTTEHQPNAFLVTAQRQ